MKKFLTVLIITISLTSVGQTSLKDDKQEVVLWTFGDHKWVLTSYENKDSFRQVDNPCPTVMKPEKQFLPIE